MTADTPPPRGLRWTDTRVARGLSTVLSVVALGMAILLGYRGQVYITCIGSVTDANAKRSSAIARATDTERAMQLQLLQHAGQESSEQFRRAVIDAYAATDRVREANPPVYREC